MDGKSRIMVAFLTLTKSLSLKNVTMDDIARQAGISKKTLYQHFRNKNEVIDYVVERSHELFANRCKSIIANAGNAVQALCKIADLLDEISFDWNRISLYQFQKYYSLSYDKYIEGLEAVHINMISEVVSNGRKAGLFREGISPALFANYRISQLFLFAEKLLGCHWNMSERRIINDLTIRGLLTEKGMDEYNRLTKK